MFTVGAVVLTAVQRVRPVFQSIRPETQSSAFTQSGDSGQLSCSVALAAICQELLNPTDCLLTHKTTATAAKHNSKLSKLTVCLIMWELLWNKAIF